MRLLANHDKIWLIRFVFKKLKIFINKFHLVLHAFILLFEKKIRGVNQTWPIFRTPTRAELSFGLASSRG